MFFIRFGVVGFGLRVSVSIAWDDGFTFHGLGFILGLITVSGLLQKISSLHC